MSRLAQPTSQDLPSRPEADDLMPAGNPLSAYVWVDAERMSGAPCFRNTRVPLKNLCDYLEGGEPLAEFLTDFEGVTAEQARAILRAAFQALLEKLPKP